MTLAVAEAHVALIGNPNTGKTSLFNALTGLNQRVGNYPGVTVEKKTGVWKLGESRTVRLVDLPGTYTLAAASPDERIAVDVLSGRMPGLPPPDAVIVVVDAENLGRNLFLASQIGDLQVPVVIALNYWDIAEQKNLRIDVERLSASLGVPVVPTVGKRSQGTEALGHALGCALAERPRMVRPPWPEPVREALAQLRRELIDKRGESLSEGELQRLLFDRHSALRGRLQTNPAEHGPIVDAARERLRAGGYHPDAAESLLRHRFIDGMLAGAVGPAPGPAARTRTESIDDLLLHRVWGLIVFAALMSVVFQAVYSWAGPAMGWIEGATGVLQEVASSALSDTPVFRSLVSDGVIGGVGAFLVFLPQILILFAFIALLEETGYMARAAFLMDKLFSWSGLNGKSFVPLLSSYACAVPGILATRTINDNRARTITILIAPLMSCSARLPVYVLLIGAFVEPRYGPAMAGGVLFAMHFVGAAAAAPLAWILNRCLSRGAPPKPFFMELPPYRVPALASVARRVLESGREFVVRAGTVILAMTIIIWALLYFPRPPELADSIRAEHTRTITKAAAAEIGGSTDAGAEIADPALERKIDAAYLEQSYLGRFGHQVQPLFALAGYDWKLTVGVLASFPAREVIISTLGITYALGGEVDEGSRDMRRALAKAEWSGGPRAGEPVFTLPVAFSLMIFFALCLQCGATVAVIAKELNWLWAIGAFTSMSLLAWTAAVVTYQLGTALS